MDRSSLTRYAWLSIAAAIVTIGLKSFAYLLTGSVGLLSDAVESLVNLVAAIHGPGHADRGGPAGGRGASVRAQQGGVLRQRRGRDPDPAGGGQHRRGGRPSASSTRDRWSRPASDWPSRSWPRPINFSRRPHPAARRQKERLDHPGSRCAPPDDGRVDLGGRHRRRRGRGADGLGGAGPDRRAGGRGQYRADGLSTDAAVDRGPDGCGPAPGRIREADDGPRTNTRSRASSFTRIRTRQSAGRRFVSIHVLVPGRWTTHKGHHVVEDIETDIRGALSGVIIFTHMEPVDDPLSFQDIDIDR